MSRETVQASIRDFTAELATIKGRIAEIDASKKDLLSREIKIDAALQALRALDDETEDDDREERQPTPTVSNNERSARDYVAEVLGLMPESFTSEDVFRRVMTIHPQPATVDTRSYRHYLNRVTREEAARRGFREIYRSTGIRPSRYRRVAVAA